jgi:hypothetical protein
LAGVFAIDEGAGNIDALRDEIGSPAAPVADVQLSGTLEGRTCCAGLVDLNPAVADDAVVSVGRDIDTTCRARIGMPRV